MRASGFTLIELMIVVAVIAILALIAYPTYRSAIVRGNQANAQEFLLDVINASNQYRLDTRNYPTSLGAGAGEIDLPVPDAVSRNYTVTATADNSAAPPTFGITATPRAGSIQAAAATLRITNTGKKTPPEVWK